ncbi:bifunctional glutamate N-acetyltransferase/amino-acid acetyltransferase ArgJ [Acaryochloris sp. 'Moss Beach']|uniref:bifunctional glutamate N-acetyltransferase/amino-acid acetyltransferase ArgJ n=1 Tax=Acaryochloris sp. 'Moss Beach' TaxID=2740837 RepID=UPI001F46B481|nr:bifunctional glutamate N-acetyltransferase/amino-acid acetyltransferase ArgJ [Acaryochloris sp. 'Moss Beach']UJB70172.1 bifunctional glutamate N-acetyltransferase/amino-acid acetyltransferase ArgJ [Acaryochloris sp. 'Moss Beach']
MADWQTISGGVTAPQGYRAAGMAAGLKPSGAKDLALIVSDVKAHAAGVFTTNRVKAACVTYSQERLQTGPTEIQAILCNSGQANAGTGPQGDAAALAKAKSAAQTLGLTPEAVLIASTGVIGEQVPVDKVEAAMPQLVEQLSVEGSDQAAQAIMTTDLVPKTIALETYIGGQPVRVGGIAKGSGMIHPDMATLLVFVTCDAQVEPALWQQMIGRAADRSFNQVTVDGDTSTNDMLLALANGQSSAPAIQGGPEADQVEALVTEVCKQLAQKIARDGEGATCLIEVQVQGAADEAGAQKIAKTIAGSTLVKSAVFGRDPNWGRIAMAAGRAGVDFDATQLHIQLGDFVLMHQGTPQAFDREAASQYLHQDPVIIQVSVGDGNGKGKAWGCDLSYDYVKINAEYTT